MRNIWVYIVVAVVALGGAVAIFNAVNNNNPTSHIKNDNFEKKKSEQEATLGIVEPDRTFGTIETAASDIILGKKNAPVTIIEYASLTCGHCSDFHLKVLPEIKKLFIETGKVKFIYRDFPLDQWALRASIIARCAGPERRYSFIETFFAQQKIWTRGNPAEGIVAIAKLGGMDFEKTTACLQDEKIANAVVKERLTGTKLYEIEATPTILVNGDRYSGGLSAEQLRVVVENKLKIQTGGK